MKTLITALLIITLTACNSTGDDMTITIIDENITLEDSNITEDIPSFSPLQRIFAEDDQVTSGNFVYQRVGKDITVSQFDDTKEDYSINDLVFTDKLEYVFQNKGEQLVAKQPETYSNDTSLLPSNWINRYVHIGVFNNNEISTTSDGYNYYFNKYDSDIYTSITNLNVESGVLYEREDSRYYKYVYVSADEAYYKLPKNSGTDIKIEGLNQGNLEIGKVYVVDSTLKVKLVELKETSNSYEYYSIIEITNDVVHESRLPVLSVSSVHVAEPTATKINNHAFYPKTYILRGLNLYMRTDVDLQQQTEIVDVTSIQLLPITSPVTIPWGWSILRPTMKYALLDSEKNTKMTSSENKYFILKSSKPFDTIVLNSIIASKVKVTINGVTTERTPVNVLTMRDKSITAPTKIAMYYDEMYPAGTSVMIEVETLNGLLELGGVYLGEKYNIGMTDIPFEKRFERIQTLTPNEFGQVEFVDRAVVEKYSSTVTFESRYFSFLDAFFRENLAGGRKAFFDGGDNTKNVDGDTNKIKNAMALMGRAVDNPLQHFEENGHEAEYGKMQIEVREDV